VQSSWGEQISRIQIEPMPIPHEEASTTVLSSMIDIGAAISGIVAFFSLRRLDKFKPE